MAKLIYELNQSLDGYVDHTKFRPSPALFRHWIERVRDLKGIIYGRGMYEIMRYWDEDLPSWKPESTNSQPRGGAGQSGSYRARCSQSAPTPPSSPMTWRA